MKSRRAPEPPAPNAALDALAAELAPRVAALLCARATADDADAALAELLERAGYELDSGDGVQT